MSDLKLTAHDPNDRNQDSGGSPPSIPLVSRLKTGSEVLEGPLPRWLVKHLVEENALVMMFGKPGAAKSFLGLDLAMHLANGQPWHGIKVNPTSVVYVVAEGGKGIRKRLKAFMAEHPSMTLDKMSFLLEALHLDTPAQLERLLNEIRALPTKPGLIVLDTFARCFSGDENNTAEMGKAVRTLEAFRQDLGGATVLLVHHMTKNGTTYRGSSALEGAVDTMIEVSKNAKNIVTIKTKKQKDAANGKPMTCELHVVDLGLDEDNEPVTSCVLRDVSSTASAGSGLQNWQEVYLVALLKCGGTDVRCVDWSRRIEELAGEISSFDRHKDALLEHCLASKVGKSKAVRWSLTPDGAAIAQSLLDAAASAADCPPVATPEQGIEGFDQSVQLDSAHGNPVN